MRKNDNYYNNELYSYRDCFSSMLLINVSSSDNATPRDSTHLRGVMYPRVEGRGGHSTLEKRGAFYPR